MLGYELAEDKKGLTGKVFVDAPNDQLVRPSRRCWNSSGVNVSVGADGVDVAMELLGVARRRQRLRRAGHRAAGRAAAAGTAFPLFASFRAVTEISIATGNLAGSHAPAEAPGADLPAIQPGQQMIAARRFFRAVTKPRMPAATHSVC